MLLVNDPTDFAIEFPSGLSVKTGNFEQVSVHVDCERASRYHKLQFSRGVISDDTLLIPLRPIPRTMAS